MKNTQEKIANPVKYYNHPNDVEHDNALTIEEKIILLKNWLDDINLRQTAEAENMQSNDNGRTYIADIERLLHHYQIKQLGGESGQ